MAELRSAAFCVRIFRGPRWLLVQETRLVIVRFFESSLNGSYQFVGQGGNKSFPGFTSWCSPKTFTLLSTHYVVTYICTISFGVLLDKWCLVVYYKCIGGGYI